ncbi:hypothetical protein PMIN05_001625 [Paraphaeosphaeria minitans]
MTLMKNDRVSAERLKASVVMLFRSKRRHRVISTAVPGVPTGTRASYFTPRSKGSHLHVGRSQLCSISDDAWAPKGLSTGLWTEVGDGNTSLRRLVEGQRRSCFAQHLVSRSLCNAEVDDVSTPLSRLA